ncbi:ASCH domain-containing protein [Lactiplantibacillus plantarum]|uniref:ASCH domain-containing protein n=1 Tax=Lactiplantibacillus plantarum TaxID=1590 RepID=UPI000C7EC43A|nr:ASCH domain-containing protein [Lactiplantibacillus plantarum]
MPAQSAEQLWHAYNESTDTNGASYQTRWFGQQTLPSEVTALADAILAGTKTATTTPLDSYTRNKLPFTQVGDYNVLLNGDMKPGRDSENGGVLLIPFYRISAEHAYHEGDGDRTIGDWRKRKTAEFTPTLEEHGKNLSSDTPMVSEVFEVVYRAD